MGFETFIIVGYFLTLLIPVATVVIFFVSEGDDERVGYLPVLDSYELPEEGLPIGLLEAAGLEPAAALEAAGRDGWVEAAELPLLPPAASGPAS